MKSRPRYKKKRYVMPATIILLLISLRVALPYIVKDYVNDTLAEMDSYTGHVDDIDIALWRGAYVIKGLELHERSSDNDVPMIELPQADISIEWKSLLDGRIVSEIFLDAPAFIYTLSEHQEDDGMDEDDWSQVLTDLVPLEINHLEISGGKAALLQLNAEPDIDLQIHSISLDVKNMRNVRSNGTELPSALTMEGTSIGGGRLSAEGSMDLVQEIPDIDIAWRLEDMDVTALNNLTDYYASIDMERGTASVYSELVIADDYLEGYIKPILKDVQLLGGDENIWETIYEGAASLLKFVLKNHRKDNLATKVPFEGDLSAVEADSWSAVLKIIENAWIDALDAETDGEIDYAKALESMAVNKK